LLLQFSLVIVTPVSERPEFRLPQAVVDRKIRAADIDRPAPERWAGLS